MALQSLDVQRRSATSTASPQARKTLEVAKLIDVSRCIGCKACQSACMEWNDLRDEVGVNEGFYTNPKDLSDQSWTLMRFYEENIEGSLQWLILKDGCLHCTEPGCLKACPAPGAIVQFTNGLVDFHQENCIGCGYCISGCPFNIPRLSKHDNKAYKCTLCSDRVSVGLEPACIKTCPTQALSFGSKEDMLAQAEHRLDDLRERGFTKAAVYDPQGVGGTHVVFVLPHGDQPEKYGLPKDPHLGPLLSVWRSWVSRSLGVFTMFAVVVAGVFHYMKVGPLEEPKDDPPAPPSPPRKEA
ncbi:formate dehydrogenase subunit beta [Anaeromyxobacter diazotrophicus]|uniref:Formate dehydrogenase-O iron-sulfur subunit n=1 Tax=Anaeromyxobacter diazotrophicus TaxID=2590199 RepID=A0A7I9VLR2_9BACT|nr:formate dehydrogenase subunit beta [Anaeromyxobacter diazotrophicus]GEJ57049.1 formate dehydrogenase-O iron-sulfur subunit [Anaeromyxobacter diazotrophicus]